MNELKKKYRVVLIEPSEIIQIGLKIIFNTHPEFEIIYSFTDLAHFSERANILHADIILLNPILLDYQKRINIKSVLPLQDILYFALIYNYIEQDCIKQYNGIIEITDDATTIFRKLKQAIENQLANPEQGENYELSERENEILSCVARGMTNKEIADQHNISIHTVISHRKNITRKTGIKTVSGLTVYALLNNLIDQSEIE